MTLISKTIINNQSNKITNNMDKFISDLQFEGNTFKLENQYKLVKLDHTDIYEIRTKKNITFKINKEFITKLFINKVNNTIAFLVYKSPFAI
jgi:hypothetical protein